MATTSVGDLPAIRIRDFSGGWNVRDAASELAPNESPDLWNVTLDERGGISKTLGRGKYNSSVYDAANLTKNTYVWPSGAHKVTQVGAKLYLDTSTTSFKTFTTSARVGFADFQGKLLIIHPIDGLFASDGTGGGTAVVVGGPKGTAVIGWQNRVLALGDPSDVTRIQACKVGDYTTWAPGAGTGDPWENRIRVIDDSPLIGFEPALGVDILGRPGLIVGKNSSCYRIYNSDSGAYVVLSNTAGPASAISFYSIFDRVGFISATGIFEIKGAGAPELVSGKLQPLFSSTQIATTQTSLFCAGVDRDRVRFSLPRLGSTANDLALEYHPEQGWIVPGSLAAACYASDPATGLLYGGHPSTNGQVHLFDSGGSDDGTDIASWFQSRWFEPNGGRLDQLWRLRLNGRGAGSVYLRKNYAVANGTGQTFNLTDASPLYDALTSTYDSGLVYGPIGLQQTEDFFGLGTCEAVAIRFEETSSLTLEGVQIGGAGSGPTVGAWSVYGIDLLHVPLGV